MGIGVNSRTAFSLLFPEILEEFGWERGVTAAAFSVGFLASTLIAPTVGVLNDRWGPRYVISLGAVFVSSGLMLSTLITAPWQLYLTLGVLVVGGSICLSYIGHGSFIPNWFIKKRGLAVGIAFSGVGVGSMILFPLLQNQIDKVGWRQACWTMAFLMLTLVPLNLLLQRRHPDDLGLFPDGQAGGSEQQRSTASGDNIVDREWANTEWTLMRAMKTARFWWLGMGFFCGLFVWYSIQVHQTKYLIDIGFPSQQAAFALSLVSFFGIAGQILVGYSSDHIGREWGWMFSVLGFGVCYVLLLVLKQYPNSFLFYLMVICQGGLGYGIAPIYASMPAELFQGRHYGSIFGVLGTIASLGAAVGPWLTGVIYDYQGTYLLAFQFCIALSLFSVLCVWMAAPRKVRVVAGQVKHMKL
ncbi:MAG: MFS transporter [SAR324 cluster bacterium]|nr:MFS transporter [SAR324 cluster bacterium]